MFINAICSPAPPASTATPLPAGPVLALPSGDVGVRDHGWLLTIDRWVVAVALAPDLFFVTRDRTEKYVPTHLHHELLGYLVACGCTLLPVEQRCPLDWRQRGSFASVQTQWIAAFFDEAQRILFEASPPPSHRPRLALPVADRAADGAVFWEAAGRVAAALDPSLTGLPELWGSKLWKLAVRWEIYWNHLLESERKRSRCVEDAHGWLPLCDRNWAAVVRRYLVPRGYRFQRASLERLL